jgi:hypothetical protein
MLVLLGPPFSGTDADYARLAQLTGLVAYELKSRLKPGMWGVVRALGDPEQADALAQQLRAEGYRACAVDSSIGHAPARPIVAIRALGLGESEVSLRLRERSMTLPRAALLAIVRGEVQTGTRPHSLRSSSSATFRAVVPDAADLAVSRDQLGAGSFDAYAAADIHFVTVLWVARIDVRSFDFAPFGLESDSAQDLDRLVDAVAEHAGVRVDRASRTSSVASFAAATPPRPSTPNPGSPPVSREPAERFDFYSRIVAEAERQTHGFGAG